MLALFSQKEIKTSIYLYILIDLNWIDWFAVSCDLVNWFYAFCSSGNIFDHWSDNDRNRNKNMSDTACGQLLEHNSNGVYTPTTEPRVSNYCWLISDTHALSTNQIHPFIKYAFFDLTQKREKKTNKQNICCSNQIKSIRFINQFLLNCSVLINYNCQHTQTYFFP